MTKIDYSKIKSIDDIRRRKKYLSKKIRIREYIMKKRFEKFHQTATPVYFYEQFVKSINMENSFLEILPYFAKLIEPLKSHIFKKGNLKKIVPIVGGVGAGIAALFAIFKFKNKNKQNFESDEDELFI